MSKIRCDGFDTNTLTSPLSLGTKAMFEVMEPSFALSVETNGCMASCGQSVRKPSGPGGTTVALNTYALAEGLRAAV